MKIEIIPKHRLIGHKDCVYSLLYSTKKDKFFSSGGDGLVAEWDLKDARDAQLIARCPDPVYSMCLMPDADILVLGSSKGGLHLTKLQEQQELQLLQVSEQPVFAIETHGQRLYSAHGDGQLRIWDVEDKARLALRKAVPLSQAPLRSLQIAPDATQLAIGSSDGALRITDMQGRLLQQLNGHQNSVFSVLWLAGGKYILSGSRDAHLAVWESASGKLLERFPAHLFTINDLKHLPELGLIASAGRDKSIKFWDDKNLSLLKVADYEKFPGMAHSHSVNKLLWFGDTGQLVSAGDDRKVIIWSLNKKQND
jgi:WD40 repeat protein